jgi:hypothetical protein
MICVARASVRMCSTFLNRTARAEGLSQWSGGQPREGVLR